MATTYHDFEEQATNALRLTRARQYLTELQAMMGPELGADGKNRSTLAIMTLIANVRARIKELEAMPDANGGINGGISLAKPRRA